jgi:hypothetical protein
MRIRSLDAPTLRDLVHALPPQRVTGPVHPDAPDTIAYVQQRPAAGIFFLLQPLPGDHDGRYCYALTAVGSRKLVRKAVARFSRILGRPHDEERHQRGRLSRTTVHSYFWFVPKPASARALDN